MARAPSQTAKLRAQLLEKEQQLQDKERDIADIINGYAAQSDKLNREIQALRAEAQSNEKKFTDDTASLQLALNRAKTEINDLIQKLRAAEDQATHSTTRVEQIRRTERRMTKTILHLSKLLAEART